MRLFTVPITVLGTLALSAGCLSSGGNGGGVTQPGEQKSLFDDFFGGASARESSDTNTAASGSGGANNPEVPCEGDDCLEAPPNPDIPVIDAIVCAQPHAVPAGGQAACSSFCAKIAGCAGQPDAASACTADCASTLGGIEIAAAQGIFGCYTNASCDDIAHYSGGGSTTVDSPGDDRVPTPTEPSSGSGGSGGGDDGGSADPPPDSGNAIPPGEGGGTVVVDVNPIGGCIEGVAQTWTVDALPSAKLAVCESSLAADFSCSGGGAVTTSGEAPAGASSGSSGGSDSGGSEDSGGPDTPPSDGGAPQPDPAPPYDDYEEYEDDDVEVCARVASLLTQGALNRVAACATISDCDERETCLQAELACLPFLGSLVGGFGDGGSTNDVDVSEGSTEPAATPSTP